MLSHLDLETLVYQFVVYRDLIVQRQTEVIGLKLTYSPPPKNNN